MRKIGALGFALVLAACAGGESTTPPPQAPAPPVAPAPPPAPAPSTAPAVDTTPPPAAPAPSPNEKRLATIKALFDTQNAQDAKGYAALFAEDATYKTFGMPDWKGRADIQTQQQKVFDDTTGAKWGASRVFVKDDVAIVEWVAVGTDKKSSKPYGVRGASVLRFTPDALVKEEHDYIDFPTFLAQTGASKDKGRAVAELPSGDPEVHVAKGTPDEAKNVERARAILAAFTKPDRATMDGAYADDVSWEDYTTPSPMNGKATMLKMYDVNVKAWSDPSLDCNVWGVDDFAIDECEFKGRNTGPLATSPTQKIPASKKAIDVHGLDVVQLKDGKAAKGWSYGNGMEFAVQMGLMKPPAPPKSEAKKSDSAKAPKSK